MTQKETNERVAQELNTIHEHLTCFEGYPSQKILKAIEKWLNAERKKVAT